MKKVWEALGRFRLILIEKDFETRLTVPKKFFVNAYRIIIQGTLSLLPDQLSVLQKRK